MSPLFDVQVIYPTNTIAANESQSTKLFLAGSIEQGKAEEWQSRIIEDLKSLTSDDNIESKNIIKTRLTIFNPRRPDWNPNLPQEALNEVLRNQITWELDHLEMSDVICLYLDPKTTSPISLLELGLHMRSRKLLVCCPPGFYRKANIDITCQKYGVAVLNDYSILFSSLCGAIVNM